VAAIKGRLAEVSSDLIEANIHKDELFKQLHIELNTKKELIRQLNSYLYSDRLGVGVQVGPHRTTVLVSIQADRDSFPEMSCEVTDHDYFSDSDVIVEPKLDKLVDSVQYHFEALTKSKDSSEAHQKRSHSKRHPKSKRQVN
jgi:hypothetical protein